MSNLPLVSILIPIFNAEKFISKALNSIINQTYRNLEILIADDGSNDNSRVIINSFSDHRIKHFHNVYNLGYLKTCNKLFKVITGDFVAFQDADDWSDLTRIEKTVSFLLTNPEIAMCGCNFIRTNYNSTKELDSSNYSLGDTDIKNHINEKFEVPFCGASVIVRKEVYNTIGGYRSFFDRIGHEHIDWFLLISEKYKVANIPEKLYHYRYVASSFSRNNMLHDYKKYYVKDITFFLREQRMKYGYDALQQESLMPEFDLFLFSLEQKHKTNRQLVYKRLITSRLSNYDFKSAFYFYRTGIIERDVNAFIFTYYFILRITKTILKFIVK